MQQVEDIILDHERQIDDETGELPREKEREEVDDIPEEVDDIELIFSSDDNKEVIQEDLVSLSEYEPWQEPGAYGTPILTKFNTLTSDDIERETYYQRKKSLKVARFNVKEEENVLKKDQKSKSFESSDSLCFENHSFSIEKDSSAENLISKHDDEKPAISGSSGKNKNGCKNMYAFIETDISKIGVGDDEKVKNMGRRNTCPNPPIYR